MKIEMLKIQQYLHLHPVMQKNVKVRYKYLMLLKHFVDAQGESDLWGKQVLRLYADRIVGKGTDLGDIQVKDLNVYQKLKFFRYSYFLLIDCLFICSFNNIPMGNKTLNDFVDFYGERYRKKLTLVFEGFYADEDIGLLKVLPDLKRIFEVIWTNRKYMEQPEKRIMITANMSAGKSTLLNALIGKKINKTQNDACTAKIHYLYNKAGEDGLNYELDHDLELDASLDILMEDNKANDTTDIIVGTRFRSLTEIQTKVCFIDTPGVNSALDKEHRRIANEAISSIECNLLLYLFNGENIGSDDETRHLKYVKENYRGRIIFLVNRLDHYKKGIDSVSETIEKQKKELTALGFKDPEIYPVSAYAAYLAKMSLYQEALSEAELEELNDLKRTLKREEFSYDRYYADKICSEDEGADPIYQVLFHSGVLALEDIIYNH